MLTKINVQIFCIKGIGSSNPSAAWRPEAQSEFHLEGAADMKMSALCWVGSLRGMCTLLCVGWSLKIGLLSTEQCCVQKDNRAKFRDKQCWM